MQQKLFKTPVFDFPLIDEEEDEVELNSDSDGGENGDSGDNDEKRDVTPSPPLPGVISHDRYLDVLPLEETPMSDSMKTRKTASVKTFNFMHPKIESKRPDTLSGLNGLKGFKTSGGLSSTSIKLPKVRDPVLLDFTKKEHFQEKPDGFRKEMEMFVESTPIKQLQPEAESAAIIPPRSIVDPVSKDYLLHTYTCPSSIWGAKSVLFNHPLPLSFDTVPTEHCPIIISPNTLYMFDIYLVVTSNGKTDPDVLETIGYTAVCSLTHDAKLDIWSPRIINDKFVCKNVKIDIRILPNNPGNLLKLGDSHNETHFVDMQVSYENQSESQVLYFVCKVKVTQVKMSVF